MSEPDSEQAKKIFRGRGFTASERLLADLGDHAFLDLWSYPNLFYEKKKGGKGDGKEMCDMLVVCGDDIIIFSDKAIKWQDDRPLDVAWPRFYRNAVEEAVKQINGAANWIDRFPDKIFTDPACTQKLPIELPPVATRRMHGVVVATGAQAAIKKHYGDESGSFPIVPQYKGRDAVDFKSPHFFPFCIGDVNPDGMFIHVFDDLSIQRLIEHLDTITDFTQYLNERARYIRSDKLGFAQGEEELLAVYLNSTMRNKGIPTFELPRPKGLEDHARMTLDGEWRAYLISDEYFTKTMADEVSYIWDKLIKLFTDNIIAGTSVEILDTAPDVALAERGLRYMALETRFFRRILGHSLYELLQRAQQHKEYRHARTVLPTEGSATRRQAYIFLVLAYPHDLEKAGGLPGGYEQYRQARAAMLQAYCIVLLYINRDIDVAVGIALDARWTEMGNIGGSEDLMAISVDEWTDEVVADALKAQEHYDIYRKDKMQYSNTQATNYPSKADSPSKQKRAHRQRKKNNPFRKPKSK
ncbi:hypothetical protein [Bradyrhizobium sp. USDA 4506]